MLKAMADPQWRDKLQKLACSHRNDDDQEAVRFRSVPDQDRARMFSSLCAMAAAATREVRREQEEKPPEAGRWWHVLVQRERARLKQLSNARPR